MRKVFEAVQSVTKPKEKQLNSLSYRGLVKFIQNVKQADEHPKKSGTEPILTKELTHVFQELQKPSLSAYARGKSVLKVVFVSMYGYHSVVASRIPLLAPHIDFMLQSTSFSLWAVALASLSLYPELHPRLVVVLEQFMVSNSSTYEPWRVRCLLQMVTCLHEISLELASALTKFILGILKSTLDARGGVANDHLDNITQKCCLSLCKLLRSHPSVVSLLVPKLADIVAVCFSGGGLSVGVHQSGAVLLRQCFLATNPNTAHIQAMLEANIYELVLERCCGMLKEYWQFMHGNSTTKDAQWPEKQHYKFYAVIHPWLTIAVLQLLQAIDPAYILNARMAGQLVVALVPLLHANKHREPHSQTLMHAITLEAVLVVRHLHGLSVYEWLRLLPVCWPQSPLRAELISLIAEYVPMSTLPRSQLLRFEEPSGSQELDAESALRHLRDHISVTTFFRKKSYSLMVSARLVRSFLNVHGNFSLAPKMGAADLGVEDWELERDEKRKEHPSRDHRYYCNDPAFRLAREPANMTSEDLDELARIHQLHSLASLAESSANIVEIRVLEARGLGPNGASCKIKGEVTATGERLFKRRTKFSPCDGDGSCKWGGEAGVVWHDPFSHCTRVTIELLDPSGKLGDIKLEVEDILQRTAQLHKDPALSLESFQRFVELVANDDPRDDGWMSDEWGVWYPLPNTRSCSLRIVARAITGKVLNQVIQNRIMVELAACSPKLVAIEQCSHQLHVLSQGSVFYQSLVGHSAPHWTPGKRMPASQLWKAQQPVIEWESVSGMATQIEVEIEEPTDYEPLGVLTVDTTLEYDHDNDSFSPLSEMTVGIIYQERPAFYVAVSSSAHVSDLLTRCREVLGEQLSTRQFRLLKDSKVLCFSSSLVTQGVVNYSILRLVSESLAMCEMRPSLGPWNLLLRTTRRVLEGGASHTSVKVSLEYDTPVEPLLKLVLPPAGVSLVQSYLEDELEEPPGKLSLIVEPVAGPKQVFMLDSSFYVAPFDEFRRNKNEAVYRCVKLAQYEQTCVKFATELSQDPSGIHLRSFSTALRGWLARTLLPSADAFVEPLKRKKREIFLDWIEVQRDTADGDGKTLSLEHDASLSIFATGLESKQTFVCRSAFSPPNIKLSSQVNAAQWLLSGDYHFTLPNRIRFDLFSVKETGKSPPFSLLSTRGPLQKGESCTLFSVTFSTAYLLRRAPNMELNTYLILPKSWNIQRFQTGKPAGVGIAEVKGDGSIVFCKDSRCLSWTLSQKDIKKIAKPSLTLTVAFPVQGPIPSERLVAVMQSSIRDHAASANRVLAVDQVPRAAITKWVRYFTEYQACLELDMTPA